MGDRAESYRSEVIREISKIFKEKKKLNKPKNKRK
jgi:hypothetical protein